MPIKIMYRVFIISIITETIISIVTVYKTYSWPAANASQNSDTPENDTSFVQKQ